MEKRPPVPDDVFKNICQGMLEAELSGELSGLFKGECREPEELPTRKKLLHSFKIGMKFTKSFFLKIFGYDITTPGFAEDAIARLEILGSTKARGHYRGIAIEWQYYNEKMLQEAASWYRKQNFDKEGVRTSRKQREAEQWKSREQQWKEISKMLGFQSTKKEK